MPKLTPEQYSQLKKETYEHLYSGRRKLALENAKVMFRNRPDDSEAAICLAWALLENGDPTDAMEFANLAVELDDSPQTKLFRGFILSRMSIFEGALADLEEALTQHKEIYVWSLFNKVRALAGMQQFDKAISTIGEIKKIQPGKDEKTKYCLELLKYAREVSETKDIGNEEKCLKTSEEALHKGEYWFTFYCSKILTYGSKEDEIIKKAHLLELKSRIKLYQYYPALKLAKKIKKQFKNDEEFEKLYKRLQDYADLKFDFSLDDLNTEPTAEVQTSTKVVEEKTVETEEEKKEFKSNAIFYPNEYIEVFSAKTFDSSLEKESGKREYYFVFNKTATKIIGVEIIFNNPYYQIEDKVFKGRAVWYLNDLEVGRNDFILEVNQNWDAVIFAQMWGDENGTIWQMGQGRVEIYIEGFKVCDKFFGIGASELKAEEQKPTTEAPPSSSRGEMRKTSLSETKEEMLPPPESIEDLLEELDKFIGLENIKKSVRDFITYLDFIKERKKKGFKSEETISLHSVFVGNPGTGKTTIARLMGRLFRAMGILPKGHVVEVDRSGLVGQYIGETAQKTEKVIEDAMGGVLFIDEAYALVKKGGGGQDFGQEAIDVLLKRMEDKRGEFVVIAAGYPEEMETFLNSNPGLKSRFSRRFEFEDYTPYELFAIFELLIESEEYSITDDAAEFLKKEFMRLYRSRDKNFGNARLVRRIFEEAKLELSKRFINLPEDEKSNEAMTTIIIDDIQAVLAEKGQKEIQIPIDEEILQEALNELNSLTGLDSVKKEIHDLVKLARYYLDEGLDIKEKFSSHYLFLGNPGTGKTTVARIFGKIFRALGILPKGHLVETDRRGLVGQYVGQTAEKTSALIDRAIGGTLFIDEAYALVKTNGGGNDFGKEAVDTLLKRMEDDRGKFIVIAAGYTDEMRKFIESNPGIQSRFTKTINFDDYNPDNLIDITENILEKDGLTLSKGLKKRLHKYYTELYRNRDKNFGNARIVRNLIESAKQKRLIRLADLPQEERAKEENQELKIEDFDVLAKVTTKAKRYELSADPEGLKEVFDELNKLTGLRSVKESVNKLINSLKVSKLRKERGLTVIEKPLHSVFLGNPGTGKTTVARLLSRIYKELGILERGHLVEVDRADLVAGYQGQTAIKTNEIINKALGGTLFIDEAYTLSRGANDFGQEAIDTLLKRMEDHKGEFVVIVAGYTNEMNSFLKSNPGLSSRFPNQFLFEDYTPRELLEISWNIAESNGYILDEGALQLLLEIFNDLYEKRDKNFGNARTARNILYEAIANQEARLSESEDLSKEELMTITFEDVEKIADKILEDKTLS